MFPSREKGSCTAEETRKDHAKVVAAGDEPDEVGQRGVANVKTRIGCCGHYHASLLLLALASHIDHTHTHHQNACTPQPGRWSQLRSSPRSLQESA